MQLQLIMNLVVLSIAMHQTLTSNAQGDVFSYDLDHPTPVELPKEVNQVSGISFFAGGNAVFAIDDDHGDLFRISLRQHPKIERWTFGKDHDYEDLVVVNDYVYVLRSNGEIVYFPFRLPISDVKKAKPDLKGNAEFESLFKDPRSDRLIMLCKECDTDEKDVNPAFAFELKTSRFQAKPVAFLKTSAIEKLSGKKKGRFKPSAANVNPITGDLYIVSSIDKLLVITDLGLRVKQVVSLEGDHFSQPEGLCFTPAGDLLISNEAIDKKKANILIFHPKRK